MFEDQEKMKKARLNGDYEKIWQTTGKCVFCDLKPKYILYEENNVVLTINLYPYVDGQLMAIPKRHVNSIKELSNLEWLTMKKFAYVAKKLIKKVHNIKGLWTLIREGGVDAQMSVSDHLHMQFIPFPDKDLCKWNYKELKYSPLENRELYMKEDIKKLINHFDKKYADKI